MAPLHDELESIEPGRPRRHADVRRRIEVCELATGTAWRIVQSSAARRAVGVV